jgi:hypothetical protein
VARNAQTAGVLQKGVVEFLIIEDKVSRIFIRQQADQTLRLSFGFAQNRDDKIDVLGGKLDTAIRLNEFHANKGRSWQAVVCRIRIRSPQTYLNIKA